MKTHKKARTFTAMLLECRNPYLEFIRNLAPQVALLALSFFLISKALTMPFGVQDFIVLIVFFALFCYAVWANGSQLYEKCFPLWRAWKSRTVSRGRRLKMGPTKTLRYVLGTMLRMKVDSTAVLVMFFVAVFFLLEVFIFAHGIGGQMWEAKIKRDAQRAAPVVMPSQP